MQYGGLTCWLATLCVLACLFQLTSSQNSCNEVSWGYRRECCTCTSVVCPSGCPPGFYRTDDPGNGCPVSTRTPNAVTESTSESAVSTTTPGVSTRTPSSSITASTSTQATVSIFTCRPCDPACLTCTGSGNGKCIQCAHGERGRNSQGWCEPVSTVAGSGEGLPWWPIVGTVAGLVLVVAGSVLLFVFLKRHRKEAEPCRKSNKENGLPIIPSISSVCEPPWPYEGKGNPLRVDRDELPPIGNKSVEDYRGEPIFILVDNDSSFKSESEQCSPRGSPEEEMDHGTGPVIDQMSQNYEKIGLAVPDSPAQRHYIPIASRNGREEGASRRSGQSWKQRRSMMVLPTENSCHDADDRRSITFPISSLSLAMDPDGEGMAAESFGSMFWKSTPAIYDGTTTETSGYETDLAKSFPSLPSGRAPSEFSEEDDVDLDKLESSLEPLNLLDTYTVSSATQTSPGTSPTDDGPAPTFSPSWQAKGEFSSQGGILQPEHSDVALEIPPGAVDKGTFVKIKAAISTALDKAQSLLNLPEDEIVMSPIAEYSSGKETQFHKPLSILLPHFLPAGFTEDCVSVYCFHYSQTGNLILQKLQPEERDNQERARQHGMDQDGVFFIGYNQQIHLLVNHFSGYFCTHCRKKLPPPVLFLRLYAKHVEKKEGGRLVKVRVEVWDSRLEIRDFREECPDEESINHKHMQLVESSVQLQALGRVPKNNNLAVGMRLCEEDRRRWMHKTRQNGQLLRPVEQSIPLSDFVPCKCRSRIPQKVEWQLVNTPNRTPSDVFECVVDVGYVIHDDRVMPDRLRFLRRPGLVTIDVRVRKCVEFDEDRRSKSRSDNRHEPLRGPMLVNNLKPFHQDLPSRSETTPKQIASSSFQQPSRNGRQQPLEGREPEGIQYGRQPHSQAREPEGARYWRQPPSQGREPDGVQYGRQPPSQGREPEGDWRQPPSQGREHDGAFEGISPAQNNHKRMNGPEKTTIQVNINKVSGVLQLTNGDPGGAMRDGGDCTGRPNQDLARMLPGDHAMRYQPHRMASIPVHHPVPESQSDEDREQRESCV